MEFSNAMQSIEIYTPLREAGGLLTGLKQEIVLYDDEALIDPVRIVHHLDRQNPLSAGDPLEIIECVPSIYPIDGLARPVVPGQTFEYTVPGIYSRPWAEIWERYHEDGMTQPEEEDVFSFE